MSDQNYSYKPDIAIHPGETLNDVLDELGLSQKECALRLGVSEKHISQIVNCKNSITPEMAIKLERVVGGSASFWNNLDKNYHETRARLQAQKALASEVKLVKAFSCYQELTALGYVEKTRKWEEKVENLLKFFRVDSLSLVLKLDNIAFRKILGTTNKYSLAAWLRCGEIEADKIQLANFDRTKLKNKIPEFKKLTHNPKGFDDKLQELCADAGVAVVFVPYFKNTMINGAFRWVENKPLIQLNTRGAHSDIFWFTFFHELGHAILHGKKDKFLDIDLNTTDTKEIEANSFASNSLIPPTNYNKFVEEANFSNLSIRSFAKQVDVDPSIVLGRLAHDKHIPWQKISKQRPKLTF